MAARFHERGTRPTSPNRSGCRGGKESRMSEARVKAPLSVVRVQRGTMQDDVYRQAKELILNGELAPGQSITVQWLADAFGVSAMPVREAILRLTAEKALTVVAGRSLGIPHLSRERLSDLRRARMEIESLAVSWAARAGQFRRLQRASSGAAERSEQRQRARRGARRADRHRRCRRRAHVRGGLTGRVCPGRHFRKGPSPGTRPPVRPAARYARRQDRRPGCRRWPRARRGCR